MIRILSVPLPPAIEITRQAKLRPPTDIAAQMGIEPGLLEPYGSDVAKISLDAVESLADRPPGALCRGDGRHSHAAR